MVSLNSSEVDAARVPASVTVAAGATTATFVITTATVPTRTTADITATYAGVAFQETLAVTLPTPRASFTVTSPAQGSDTCVLIASGMELDCRLDGSASDGVLLKWIWTLLAGDDITAERLDAGFNEIDTTCAFVDDATAMTDSVGTYVDMTVTLVVEDRDATRSSGTSRTVKLYTNSHCGF